MELDQLWQPLGSLLPTEIILMIGNHLPFKTYIQFSQTCRTIQRTLTSTNAIGYLNHRFKFGEDTGSLLLFAYYNILYIPPKLSQIILNHFINTAKDDISFLIKGWSLIHAIHCLDPGRFMTLLLADEDDSKDEDMKSAALIEKRKRLVTQYQRSFAKEIIDSIIASHVKSKTLVCKTKTYQSVFKNLVQSGDLRTVENCLRSLGAPNVDCITLNDSDYNNRFPLIDQQFTPDHGKDSIPVPPFDDVVIMEHVCRSSLYLSYNAHEMRTLTEKLLGKYNVKVDATTIKYTSHHHNNGHIGFGNRHRNRHIFFTRNNRRLDIVRAETNQ